MADTKRYEGGCHCGAVRFEIETRPLTHLAACNCSICTRRGWLLTFVEEGQFKQTAGEHALTDYQFGKKNVHHLFCRLCGTASFGYGTKPDGSRMYSINVRCLDGVETTDLPVNHFDGKSL
jgi:hypothetical protein